jgi:hypothetical protein
VISSHSLYEVRPDDVAVHRDPDSIESKAYGTLRAELDVVAQESPVHGAAGHVPAPG